MAVCPTCHFKIPFITSLAYSFGEAMGTCICKHCGVKLRQTEQSFFKFYVSFFSLFHRVWWVNNNCREAI